MDNKIFNLINNTSLNKVDNKPNEFKRNQVNDDRFSKVLSKSTKKQKDNKEINKPLSNAQEKDVENNKVEDKGNNNNIKNKVDNKQCKKVDSVSSEDSKVTDKLEETASSINKDIAYLLQLLMTKCSKETNIEDIENAINKNLCNMQLDEKDLKQSLTNILDELKNSMTDAINETLNENGDENLLNSIKNKISNLLAKDSDKLNKEDALTSENEEISTMQNTLEDTLNVEKSKEQSGEKESNLLSEDNASKENDVLKNISGKDKTDKFSNKINFINQFTNMNKIGTEAVKGAENITVNKQTFTADVIKAVKFMDVNNLKDLTVKINPKELGELVIKITMESGKMKANITANNKEAFNILNANLSDITNKLQDSNIKIDNFTLNLYEDTTFFKDQEGSKSREESERNNHKNNKVNGKEKIENVENTNPLQELNNLSRLA